MSEGDGVALQSVSHPEDEAAAEVLLARVSEAMALAGPDLDIVFLRALARVAIEEAGRADFEFHEEMERRIEAATEDAEIEVRGAFLSEADLVVLRKLFAVVGQGQPFPFSDMPQLQALAERLGA